jgi:hypothetical protein
MFLNFPDTNNNDMILLSNNYLCTKAFLSNYCDYKTYGILHKNIFSLYLLAQTLQGLIMTKIKNIEYF